LPRLGVNLGQDFRASFPFVAIRLELKLVNGNYQKLGHLVKGRGFNIYFPRAKN